MDLLLVSALPEDTGPLIGCRLSPRGRDDRGRRDALGGRIDGRRGFRFARRAGERRHVIVQAARVQKTGCDSAQTIWTVSLPQRGAACRATGGRALFRGFAWPSSAPEWWPDWPIWRSS